MTLTSVIFMALASYPSLALPFGRGGNLRTEAPIRKGREQRSGSSPLANGREPFCLALLLTLARRRETLRRVIQNQRPVVLWPAGRRRERARAVGGERADGGGGSLARVVPVAFDRAARELIHPDRHRTARRRVDEGVAAIVGARRLDMLRAASSF